MKEKLTIKSIATNIIFVLLFILAMICFHFCQNTQYRAFGYLGVFTIPLIVTIYNGVEAPVLKNRFLWFVFNIMAITQIIILAIIGFEFIGIGADDIFSKCILVFFYVFIWIITFALWLATLAYKYVKPTNNSENIDNNNESSEKNNSSKKNKNNENNMSSENNKNIMVSIDTKDVKLEISRKLKTGGESSEMTVKYTEQLNEE